MIRALAVTHAETRLDATDSKPYVVFVVSVTGPERSWRVGRRFNQFANLYEWLEANLPQVASVLPPLPSKVTLLQKEAAVVRERCVALDTLLRALVQHRAAMALPEVQQWFGIAPTRTLYRTKSVCPRCLLVDRSALAMVDARVDAANHEVRLRVECATHGAYDTLYCSDVYFFERVLGARTAPLPRGDDMEDMGRRLLFQDERPNLPLVMDLVVVQDDHRTPLHPEQLRAHVARLRSLHPAERKFVIRLVPKSCTDMAALNAVALVTQALAPDLPLLLEATVERLVVLSGLPDSVFLKGNVYPAVKYFLQAGQHEQCVEDLTALFRHLQQFRGIQVVLTVAFDWPLPKLAPVLRCVAGATGFVRALIFSPERSPARLLKMLAPPPAASKASPAKQGAGLPEDPFGAVIDRLKRDEAGHAPTAQVREENSAAVASEPSLDPMPALWALEAEAGDLMRERDLFPASMLVTLEPFLRLLGYGRFSLLVPLSKYLDMPRFFALMTPLMPLFDAVRGTELPFKVARKLRSVFKESYVGGSEDTDISSFFTESDKAPQAQAFIDNLLFVVWHNNMDLAGVDLTRRCQCATLQSTPLTLNSLAAACTGCI